MPYFENNGARIHYDVQGEGEPVLVMHGFTESALDLEELIDALALSYRVVAPDLRGYGRSEPKPRIYTPDFYTEDAHEMASLLRHLGIERAHIAGFSDGGEVALLMPILYPGIAHSVVEWGAAGTLQSSSPGSIAEELDQIYSLVDDPIEEMAGWSRYVQGEYGEEVARSMTQGWAEASKAILARGSDISLSRAAEIECPALLISGEHDPFATPAMTRELAARIPQATVEIVQGAGHAVHHEQPAWFVGRVLGWLGRGT